MELHFPAGPVTIDNTRIRRAVNAWCLACEGRRVVRSGHPGAYVTTLTGSGKPIMGVSRLSADDADAQAVSVANERDFEQRYGTEQYRELSRILDEMQELARVR